MIQLFATDLDGTFLNKEHEIDEAIEKRLTKILEAGREFSIVTGRDHFTIPAEFKKFNIYKICQNGAMIFDKDDRLIHEQKMDSDIVREILETFDDIEFDCMSANAKLSTMPKEEFLKQMRNSSRWTSHSDDKMLELFVQGYEFCVPREEMAKTEVYKMNARDLTEEQLERLATFIEKRKDKVINAPSYKFMTELTHPSATKGQAVEILAKHLGISKKEIATFGDGWNDEDMLSQFPNSFVPCSAPKDIQALGKHIIGHNDDYAVSKKMMELLEEK